MKFLIILLFFISCGTSRIKFDPNFYVASHIDMTIMSETGHIIYAYEPQFSGFACMTKAQIVELMQLLMQTDIPKAEKKLILDKAMKLF